MKTNIQDELTIPERLTAPMPKFFKVILTIGLVLAAVGGALLSAQAKGVVLPEAVALFANYATVAAGLVATVVSALTVDLTEYQIRNALK